MNEPMSAAPRPAWPDYRAVWRWHYYASLFCMPFVVGLSLSGAVYLPLFGGPAVVVLLIEWLILTRIPAVREWLGLHSPATLVAS